ncbi:MAG TPA: hypothetical protein VH277_04805 [Gemmatimonadaceae bacterium]|jgi:hypothetical protein|nr:hypothetical protein [Gemmatimonadaceae bacterium]
MSDNAPAENAGNVAVQELELLVRHLAEELAGFRRRALVAESRLKEMEAQEGGAASLELVSRCSRLEQENERLQSRLDVATTRARQMLDRVKFLRQQTQAAGGASGGIA